MFLAHLSFAEKFSLRLIGDFGDRKRNSKGTEFFENATEYLGRCVNALELIFVENAYELARKTSLGAIHLVGKEI